MYMYIHRYKVGIQHEVDKLKKYTCWRPVGSRARRTSKPTACSAKSFCAAAEVGTLMCAQLVLLGRVYNFTAATSATFTPACTHNILTIPSAVVSCGMSPMNSVAIVPSHHTNIGCCPTTLTKRKSPLCIGDGLLSNHTN